MADEKLVLDAFGVYGIGYSLERLEWAIASYDNAAQLASFFRTLRWYEQVRSFEDIGREAKDFDDKLSSYGDKAVSDSTKNELRDARARWDTLARERLGDLYLCTPSSKIDPKNLIKGIEGFLSQECYSLLNRIEKIDLIEACGCILIGSATAAEHIALRAAESLLRRWYELKTKNKLEYKTWGVVLDRLVTEYPDENKRPKELGFLGYLKHRRDEVAHPERISSFTEADATLMTVCGLIERLEPVLTALAASKKKRLRTIKKK